MIAWLFSFGCFAHASDPVSVDSDSGDNDQAAQVLIQGKPEAPFPLQVAPAFPSLKFSDPMHVRWEPAMQRYIVCELGGKLWSFPHDEQVEQADLLADLRQELRSFDTARFRGCKETYSFVLDPDFAENRFIYVCMILERVGEPQPDGSRISRFRISEPISPSEPPTIDLSSELPIISWLDGGHNGCDLAFDTSGCLLITTGDATDPSPPDRLKTGQDISDLLGSVLRIDVRGATPNVPYVIPEDNPFRDLPDARGEVWAYGLRNPWRIDVDPASGRVFLGDVGWEKWEMIHEVVRGGNYGWAAREGNEWIQPNLPLGPTPILSPTVVLSHVDSASITGGMVYPRTRLAAIRDHYLFGDWINGRIWAFPLSDAGNYREVASDQIRIIAFSRDRDGDPLVVSHQNPTTLFRLVENENFERERIAASKFPRKLGQTGLFSDTIHLLPQGDLVPFEINQPQWQDGAEASHLLYIPPNTSVQFFEYPRPVESVAMFQSRLHYPKDAVLAKTIQWRGRRLETQILHYDGRLWNGYSYAWNNEQTDAELVPAQGTTLTITDPQPFTYRVLGRSECLQCHNPWAEITLAFTPEQLHRPSRGKQSPLMELVQREIIQCIDESGTKIDPLRTVRKSLEMRPTKISDASSIGSIDYDAQARAYLHVNCAHCHQFGAGAAVDLSLRIQDSLSELRAVEVVPSKGLLGLQSGALIQPGEPNRSIVLLRMMSSSLGRMPHIGSKEVDWAGCDIIAQWIRGVVASNIDSNIDSNDKPEVVQAQPQSIDEVFVLTERFLAKYEEDRASTETLAGKSFEDTASVETACREDGVRLAVSWIPLHGDRYSSSDASQRERSQDLARRIIALGDPLLSSLFEAHLPATERVPRLRDDAQFADVAPWEGDRERGEKWFFDSAKSQCAACHRVSGRGIAIGPDLDRIGIRQSPQQLFESILYPNRVIAPEYQTQSILLDDGTQVTGLVESQTDELLTLKNAQGERRELRKEEIESWRQSSESLMPSGLGRSMTHQEMADLLAYLSSLKD
ncbi:PQQ-dependent sugar dehydrogenase [Pirellulaceae bacterium SH449]